MFLIFLKVFLKTECNYIVKWFKKKRHRQIDTSTSCISYATTQPLHAHQYGKRRNDIFDIFPIFTGSMHSGDQVNGSETWYIVLYYVYFNILLYTNTILFNTCFNHTYILHFLWCEIIISLSWKLSCITYVNIYISINQSISFISSQGHRY